MGEKVAGGDYREVSFQITGGMRQTKKKYSFYKDRGNLLWKQN